MRVTERTRASRPARLLLAVMAAAVACGVLPLQLIAPPPPALAQEAAGEEVIVVLNEGEDPVAVAAELGVDITHVYDAVFNGFSGTLPARAMAEAASARSVRRIFLDGPVEIEEQRIPTGIRRIGIPVDSATNRLEIESAESAGIAIIDTGVTRRSDLNVAGGVDCVSPAKKKKNDRKDRKDKRDKGKKDRKKGDKGKKGKKGKRDRKNKRDKQKPKEKRQQRRDQRRGQRGSRGGRAWEDGNGHGTHTAGIAAALNNDSNVVGVAPGARIYAVKVLDSSGRGSFGDVICGLDWVVEHAEDPVDRIDVVNLSLGADGSDGACDAGDTPFHRAVCAVVDAGIPVVVAAGNQKRNASTRVPAAYDEVIAVSALADTDGAPGGGGDPCAGQEDDTFAGFSNFGADVDIMAPGVCILSLWNRGEPVRLSGTSEAAPHVTGAVAQFISQELAAGRSRPTPEETREWLLTTASLPQEDDGVQGDPDSVPEPVLWLEALGEP